MLGHSSIKMIERWQLVTQYHVAFELEASPSAGQEMKKVTQFLRLESKLSLKTVQSFSLMLSVNFSKPSVKK